MKLPGETSQRTTQGACSFCYTSGTVTEHIRTADSEPVLVYTCPICDKFNDFHDKGPNGFYSAFAFSMNMLLNALDKIKEGQYSLMVQQMELEESHRKVISGVATTLKEVKTDGNQGSGEEERGKEKTGGKGKKASS